MNEIKFTRGTPKVEKPFAWQSKIALRKIRESFDAEKTVASALGVYSALTEIASDMEKENFQTTHAYIAQKSGLSPRTVQNRLAELAGIDLVEISTPALKSPSTYRLLSVQQPLPSVTQPHEKAPLPTLEQSKKKELNKGEKPPPARKREFWQLLKDEKTLKERLETERENVKPDKELIESLRGKLREVRNDMKNKGKPLSGETSYLKAVENGASENQLDKMSESFLP